MSYSSEIISHLSHIVGSQVLFLDTETTGLYWHQGNKPFSIIIADDKVDPIYINLFSYNGTRETASSDVLSFIQKILRNEKCRIVAHNAKFDLHMLANLGLRIDCEVYDTMTMHRLIDNKRMSYSLDALTGTKSDAVKDWIRKNPKLGKIDDPLGSGKKIPAYWRVPYEIMVSYAIQDVIALRKLYQWQQDNFKSLWRNAFPPAYFIELKATKTIWECERRGIRLDSEYALQARQEDVNKADKFREEFKKITGQDFVDSGKSLGAIYASFGIILPLTDPSPKTQKQEYRVDEETLSSIKHPLSEIIISIRKAEKRVSTYFDNYLRLRNPVTGAVHCDFRQAGADTMRMSASAPNVQNSPDESEDTPAPNFPIRGCFIPRPGYKLVSIDFSAQEMRAILDTAEETDLANKILGGEDVHQATADMMGVMRKLAKNIAFGIIYGSGAEKTASQIRCSVQEARRLRDLYFSRLPNVRKLSKALMQMAEEHGYIVTRFGNRLFIEPNFAYKAVNYFVQGSCAIHTKNAANMVRDLLVPYKSKILLLIHDELLIEMHESEMSLIPTIQKLMAEAYPHNILPQNTGVEIYKYRWGGETIKST